MQRNLYFPHGIFSDRTDFTETLFWCDSIKTDEKGQATIQFDLCDSISSFRAIADGFHSTDKMYFNLIVPKLNFHLGVYWEVENVWVIKFPK